MPLNVLLVTYSFPPSAGVGVLRAANLARYLPQEGIRLDVITARNASRVGRDESILKEIPHDVNVHDTFTLDLPFGLKKSIKRLLNGAKSSSNGHQSGPSRRTGKSSILKRALQDLLLPDPQVLWLPILVRAARRIIRERSIELVLITVPPFSTMLLVEKLRREFPQLPVVIDFRDEWLATAIDLVGFSKSERAREIAQKTEAAAVKSSTAIVAATEAARRVIRGRYPQEPQGKFHVVPNGFDATLLSPKSNVSRPRRDDRIVVSHIGTLYPSTEPSAFVEAISSLPVEIRTRFKFRFIGHIEEAHYRESLLRLGDMVELLGFRPQKEALAEIDETDYVLLIQHGPLNVAAKFYDYIGSGKPILATIHPQGDECRLLEELRAGWWATSRDVEAIRRLFMDAAARGHSPFSDFQPDQVKIAAYERKVLAQRYARLLHGIAKSAQEAHAPVATAVTSPDRDY